MSIFDDISAAEKLDPNDKIELEAGKFLDLINLWIFSGYLLSCIEEQNDEGATEAIFKIADTYGGLSEKYS